MAYLIYKSRLVPRFIPVMGLVGVHLILVLNAAKMFGFFEQIPAWAGIAVIPIFAWEVSLAIWLIAKGFNVPANAFESAQTSTNKLLSVS